MNALWARIKSILSCYNDGEADGFGAILRHGLTMIFLFFGVFGAWAIFGEISGAVVVPGTIKIDTQRKTVQHLEGGIIETIHVREGEKVEQGQPLISLRNVTAHSAVDMANKNLIIFLAAKCRYEAEKRLFDKIKWTDELLDLVDRYHSQDVLDNEQKSFDARRASYESQVAVLSSQEKELEEQIKGLLEELAAEKTIIETLKDELASKKALFEKKYLEKSQVLELQRQLATHQGAHGKLRQSIAASKQQKNGLKLQREGLGVNVMEQAAAEINTLDGRILQTREELRPLLDSKHRLQVLAPVGGIIVGLKVHSPGGVISSGQELMDIVPENSPLLAEVHIPVEKIADVFVGQEAQAQLDAFARSKDAMIPAKVMHIAADRQEEQTSMGMMPYYLSHVQVFPEKNDSPEVYISPGMPVTVFITTKKQTILHYMFEPLLRSWDRALRE